MAKAERFRVKAAKAGVEAAKAERMRVQAAEAERFQSKDG